MSRPQYSPRYLTKKLRELATEAISVDDDLNPVDRATKLANIVWDRALGWTEEDPKTGEEKKHQPQQWALSLVFDRLDGKVGDSNADDEGLRTPLSEKISEVGKARLNSIAATVALPDPPMPDSPDSLDNPDSPDSPDE